MKRITMTVLLAAAFLLGAAPVAGAATAPASPHVAAKADCYPGCSGGSGGNPIGHKPATTPPTTPSAPASGSPSAGTVAHTTAATSTSLAFTGADVALTAGVAVLLVAAGFVLVRITRRRQPAA